MDSRCVVSHSIQQLRIAKKCGEQVWGLLLGPGQGYSCPGRQGSQGRWKWRLGIELMKTRMEGMTRKGRSSHIGEVVHSDLRIEPEIEPRDTRD